MKLTLAVDKPPSGRVFHPGDKVEGCVKLQLPDGTKAPDIRVVFQGTAKVSLKPGFDAAAQISEPHQNQNFKLFSLVKTLNARLEDEPNANPSDQTFSASFSFPFPQYARCCDANMPAKPPCRLPPSTSISSPGLKVRITYSVTAICRRPGRLHHILRSMESRQLLDYAQSVTEQLQMPIVLLGAEARRPQVTLAASQLLGSRPASHRSYQIVQAGVASQVGQAAQTALAAPLSDTDDSQDDGDGQDGTKLIRSTAWLPASKLGLSMGTDPGAKQDDGTVLPPGCLPPYSPAMTLEAVMPYPPVVTPGHPIPLKLFIRTPRALLDAVGGATAASGSGSGTGRPCGGGIQLRSLSVRLRRMTFGRIGTSARAYNMTWPLWSIKGTLPICQEKVDVACGLRNELPSIPGAVQPGFWSCFVSRAYSIEVMMGVSKGASRDIQYTTTSIHVVVSEPPPAYGNSCST